MYKFRVFIEGRNFLIAGADGEAKHGFYTARYVEASDPQAAEEMAIEQLRARDSLREVVRNPVDDPPMLYATEIDEIEAFDDVRSPGEKGLVWYPEEEGEGPLRYHVREDNDDDTGKAG